MLPNRKTAQLCIRFTDEQLRRLKRVALILGKARGETIEVSRLFRDFGMEKVDAVLADHRRGREADAATAAPSSEPAA